MHCHPEVTSLFSIAQNDRKLFSIEESQIVEGSLTIQRNLPPKCVNSTDCWNQESPPWDPLNWQSWAATCPHTPLLLSNFKIFAKLLIKPCCIKSWTFGSSWETGRWQQLAYIPWTESVGSHAGTCRFPEFPQLWDQMTLLLALSCFRFRFGFECTVCSPDPP